VRWLEHPLTRGLDIDDPRTTAIRRHIVRTKPVLRDVYRDWYVRLVAALPPRPGAVLELGAGGGFLDEVLPGVVRSEVFPVPGVDATLDALALPFAAQSLRGIVMTNVLHHLPRPAAFLDEAARCVRAGGVVAMVEPWNTPWSRLVYRHLHHEPFEPESARWEAAGEGPLSRANGALPWILFARDRERLRAEHPQWELRTVEPFMPLRYLASGGVSHRDLVPAFTIPLWRGVESALRPLRAQLAMFATVVLERR
jgi:SAM-dependent methyltransferase